MAVTFESKKPGQIAVVYHYWDLSRYFLTQTLFKSLLNLHERVFLYSNLAVFFVGINDEIGLYVFEPAWTRSSAKHEASLKGHLCCTHTAR